MGKIVSLNVNAATIHSVMSRREHVCAGTVGKVNFAKKSVQKVTTAKNAHSSAPVIIMVNVIMSMDNVNVIQVGWAPSAQSAVLTLFMVLIVPCTVHAHTTMPTHAMEKVESVTVKLAGQVTHARLLLTQEIIITPLNKLRKLSSR